MKKDYIHKQFWNYVLPSMFTMLLSGFYAIVDGLFVGNAVGDTALGAINLAYPIQVILNATAIGLGIGGSVVMSRSCGDGREDKARHAMGSTLALLLASGILLSAVLLILHPMLLRMLGAKGAMYAQARSYIIVVLMGGLLPVLGNGLNPLLRNYGKTFLATAIMSSGLITNIILDYVFVFRFHMGLAGAAWATITAQGVVAVLTLLYMYARELRSYSRKDIVPDVPLVKSIARIGLSPFGQTMAPSFVIVLTNWMCLRYGGDAAVTIYSVVSYVLCSAQLLLQGIGDGVQPLISFYYGAKKEDKIHILYRKAFFVTVAASLVFCIAVVLFLNPLTALFGISDAIFEGAKTAILITTVSFPFLGITRVTSAIFYATEKTRNSTFLVYMEPCLLLPLSLFVLSFLFQLSGIWAAYPVAQILLCTIALFMKNPLHTPVTVPQTQEQTVC
ncbi:MATE family efflux transporter [[Clostridium] innocuum]|nr:MATE family efflux transporter [[Clostridium] innocuum]MCR0579337.1 MATE family efflux transporter [[Clostridium] innocuum]